VPVTGHRWANRSSLLAPHLPKLGEKRIVLVLEVLPTGGRAPSPLVVGGEVRLEHCPQP